MSLFICSNCECIENTALCGYWYRQDKNKPVCSECDPKIRKWHNKFSKEKWNGKDKIISI
jgi:hypothetical protein